MITGYVGLIGQGKTMLAVREAVALALRRNAILASNILIGRRELEDGSVEVTLPELSFHRLSVGEQGLEGVPELLLRAKSERRGVVIMADELGIITPARFWQTGMSIDLMWAMSQSRKLGGDLVFTAQNIGQVDSFLRKLTQYAHRVRAYPAPSIERRELGKRPLFYQVQTFQPEDVDDMRPERRLGRSFIRYRRVWETWYSTDELVHPPSFLRGRRPRSQGASRPERAPEPEGRAAEREAAPAAL